MFFDCADVTAPDILCPDNVTVDAIPNDSVANVSWTLPLTIDNSGEEPVVTVHPAVYSPWLFPIGHSVITYSATDKAGNTASCRFNVAVIGKRRNNQDKRLLRMMFLSQDDLSEW